MTICSLLIRIYIFYFVVRYFLYWLVYDIGNQCCFFDTCWKLLEWKWIEIVLYTTSTDNLMAATWAKTVNPFMSAICITNTLWNRDIGLTGERVSNGKDCHIFAFCCKRKWCTRIKWTNLKSWWFLFSGQIVTVSLLGILLNGYRCRIEWRRWILVVMPWWQPISRHLWQWAAVGHLSSSSSNPFIQYLATCGNNLSINSLRFLYCHLFLCRRLMIEKMCWGKISVCY